MVYEFVITVPANRPKSSPVEIEALVDPGIITHIEVEMAAGCHRYVHVAIVEGAYQIWPRNPEGSLATDDYVISEDEYYPLKRGHNLLKIRGWSPGTSYSHKVTVRFTVLPKNIAGIMPIIELLTKLLKRLGGI